MPDSLERGLSSCDTRCIASRVPYILRAFWGTGQNIRKLVKDGFVIRKPQKIHSRSRARAAQEAKSKGRHTGYGTLHLTYKALIVPGGQHTLSCNCGWAL